MRKAVITAGGLGTRLLPFTKELPKEMLPLYIRERNMIVLKPLLQAIFEQLYDVGFKEFCFVVGKEKRAIEDHFTPDYEFLNYLLSNGKIEIANLMSNFYEKVKESVLFFVNQPSPRGFGDAVLRAEPFANENFLLHAGDTYIISNDNKHIKKLLSVHENYKADATLLVYEVEDPRRYGVITPGSSNSDVIEVVGVEEKPEKPKSRLAIVPVYVFNPVIFKALQKIKEGKGGELQLTDAIEKLIDWGLKVVAVKLTDEEESLDIGTPETYIDAINKSYKMVNK
ncbi:MAG: sugar phosphate nucleotidyltransferase [Thermoproteota archaeon]|nr:NTP transferase domain-containing protein [Candidatus Brockarchaeota archaeon]